MFPKKIFPPNRAAAPFESGNRRRERLIKSGKASAQEAAQDGNPMWKLQ